VGSTYDLESVGNDADGHELLAVVAAVHHERVGEALNDGAVGLAEALGGIATGGVRDIDGVAEGDVVAVTGGTQLSAYRAQVDSKLSPIFRPDAIVSPGEEGEAHVREMSRTSTS